MDEHLRHDKWVPQILPQDFPTSLPASLPSSVPTWSSPHHLPPVQAQSLLQGLSAPHPGLVFPSLLPHSKRASVGTCIGVHPSVAPASLRAKPRVLPVACRLCTTCPITSLPSPPPSYPLTYSTSPHQPLCHPSNTSGMFLPLSLCTVCSLCFSLIHPPGSLCHLLQVLVQMPLSQRGLF